MHAHMSFPLIRYTELGYLSYNCKFLPNHPPFNPPQDNLSCFSSFSISKQIEEYVGYWQSTGMGMKRAQYEYEELYNRAGIMDEHIHPFYPPPPRKYRKKFRDSRCTSVHDTTDRKCAGNNLLCL